MNTANRKVFTRTYNALFVDVPPPRFERIVGYSDIGPETGLWEP
jgi:hypothetical protein